MFAFPPRKHDQEKQPGLFVLNYQSFIVNKENKKREEPQIHAFTYLCIHSTADHFIQSLLPYSVLIIELFLLDWNCRDQTKRHQNKKYRLKIPISSSQTIFDYIQFHECHHQSHKNGCTKIAVVVQYYNIMYSKVNRTYR